MAGYRVYVGPDQSGPIVGTPIDLGKPTPVSGLDSATITLDRTVTWVAEMTAYSTAGESPRSNRVTIPALVETLGAPLYEADFTRFAAGTLPPGYMDATGTFTVAASGDGNRAFASKYSSITAAARYIGSSSSSWTAYEISGRMMLALGSSPAGVAVRVPSSSFTEYYALGVDSRGAFALSQAGKAGLACASSASTGVSPATSRWYQFKLRFTNPSGRARLRAKVWQSGYAEPASWQADCWTDVTLTLGSGSFALYHGSNRIAYWDDLVVRPVTGTLAPIP